MRTETIISRALLCLAMNMPVGVAARANVNGDEAPHPAAQADADGADVPRFTALTLTGNDEDAPFRPAGRGLYRTYARLRRGTFRLTGTTAAGDVALSPAGGGRFTLEQAAGGAAFAVDDDCVARITVDAARGTVDVMPVTMHVRGTVAAGSPELQYAGAGIWRSQVTLTDTPSQQWVDKTIRFALNDEDSLAIRRLRDAPSRFALGMEAEGQRTEDIMQNAGTYTVSVDMRADTFGIAAPVDEDRISVFGSSVANGQGAEGFRGYRYLYGELLRRRHADGLSPNAFYTSNVSIGGNTTQSLLGRYDDLVRDFGRYVIFGLSLGNEGIHGAADPEAVFARWRDNMLRLIDKARADGKIPVVMNNYTRGDYDEADYGYVRRLNLLIHEWPVPSFNCLGSIDDGRGRWADGYEADTYHQNTAGHFEFFTSMVPSLFDALRAGKPSPVRLATSGATLAGGRRAAFVPEGTCHPFTLTARVASAQGRLMSLSLEGGEVSVDVEADGSVRLSVPGGGTLQSAAGAVSEGWHYVTLTSYYAQRRTLLYVDGRPVGELPERLGRLCGADVGCCRLRELFFWRSAMTPDEVAAVCAGRMLKSSLEIYVPLAEGRAPLNRAQSTNAVRLLPDGGASASVSASAPAGLRR